MRIVQPQGAESPRARAGGFVLSARVMPRTGSRLVGAEGGRCCAASLTSRTDRLSLRTAVWNLPRIIIRAWFP